MAFNRESQILKKSERSLSSKETTSADWTRGEENYQIIYDLFAGKIGLELILAVCVAFHSF